MLPHALRPQSRVTPDETARGLRLLVIEAAFSGGAAALTTGVILTAFALHLGASNIMVGVLASAPFLTQLLQLPAILLVERLRARKRIAVVSSLVGRSMLGVMALAALIGGPLALRLFLIAQYLLCVASAIGSCAWNAWLRDLAPEDQLGRVFARRSLWLTGVGLVLGLAAAFALQLTPAASGARSVVFAAMFAAGCVTGLISARVVARMPEPMMPAKSGPIHLGALLRQPFRDRNFSRLLTFLGSWQFAVNLATPFFTVFIVCQLGFDISFVMLLSVVSQLANLFALRLWGSLSDRYANKSVLAVCAPVYVGAIVAMIGASQMGNHAVVAGWLVMLHILMGASIAGVTLTSTNIALKLSPKGTATAYVAANAMVTALAAGIAPLLGGAVAEVFARRRLELILRWNSPKRALSFPLTLTSWDFYFLIAGLLGLYAIHRLSVVEERGEVERREMVNRVISETWRGLRNMSSVAGLRAATDLPASLLHDARLRLRWTRVQDRVGRTARRG